MSCDVQGVCVDEASCYIMYWMITGVYVKKSWRYNTPLWQAINLQSLSYE